LAELRHDGSVEKPKQTNPETLLRRGFSFSEVTVWWPFLFQAPGTPIKVLSLIHPESLISL